MIKKITRNLNSDEVIILGKLIKKSERELKSKNKNHYYPIAIVLGIGFVYLASIISIQFLVFVFGTLAVILFSFVIFTPYELYKDRKRHKKNMLLANQYLAKKQIEVIPIRAKRIAIGKEYEDEGDLIIVEYDTNKILYLWDYDYNLKKKFPCLEFDIYEDDFFKLIGKQVYPITEKIKPIIIKAKDKWNYFKKIGAPGHMETINMDFDELILKYNNVA
tara:strand:- start:970 stop:1626 length:657 start_codon:yes stop_codon:yes gene_type:complete